MKFRLLFSMLFCSFLLSGVSQAQSVGLIGSATPGGWDADTNMVQSLDSAHLWSMVIDLNVGAVKFRQDDAWDINWGDKAFPTGVGTQGGPDIAIPAAGQWTISFNSITGAYQFAYTSDIGIIGDATPGGWDNDTKMYYDPADSNKYFITLNLTQASAKFRANSAWDINWGAADFPAGIGTQGGANIPIPAAGKYLVNFDKVTGAYSFEEVLEFGSIGLIGSATPGGWDTETALIKDNGDPNLWKANITLLDGEAKFRANNAWAISWGDTLFPSGVGILSGPNIPVTAGDYQVTFNTATFEYNFLPLVFYQTVGIIGNATPGGWDNDTDMIQDPTDPSIWRLRVILTDGEAKFRADNDWPVNWGAGDFPAGVGLPDGANIPIPAGEYKITFNSTTGAYNFELLVIFNTVGLIGTATPDGWNSDVNMNKDAIDESFWFLNSIDLVDGEAKFRAEDAWAVNWGLAQWPSGVGVQEGANIPVTGGTYRVTINTASGEYAFLPPGTSTVDLLSSSSISIAPNPVTDWLNIEIKAEELNGEARVIILNSLGAQVLTQTLNIQDRASINVAKLVPGNYFVQIVNDKYSVGKAIVVVK